jgi:threonine dehydrogenase-like Zn-dependent dehydrogenase
MVLRVHGYDTFIYSAEAANTPRADLIASFGARYISAKDHLLGEIKGAFGAMDAIYEAVGITSVAFEALDALAANGVCVLTGIPGATDSTSVEMSRVMRNLVLKNQLIFGTVNAGVEAFESAVAHLEQFMFLFPESVKRLLSRHPMSEGTELIRKKKGIKDIVRIAA